MARLIIFLTVFLLFGAGGCAAQEQSGRQDNLSEAMQNVNPYYWDFQEIKEGEVAARTFIITNESPKAITIKSINTSCGCTASKADKMTLGPGESSNIQVKFDSKGYSGKIRQHVYVNTDDTEDPVIKLDIAAEVVK